jgi:ribosome biogenesis protein MAK21
MANRAAKSSAKATSSNTTPLAVTKAKGKGGKGLSEALRQAVKDLGGDEEDLELIDGVDDDEGDGPSLPKEKGKGNAMDEVGGHEFQASKMLMDGNRNR